MNDKLKQFGTPLTAAPTAPQEPRESEIIAAVARGWCHPGNSAKPFDTKLANAIVVEVLKTLRPAAPTGSTPVPNNVQETNDIPYGDGYGSGE